MKGFLQRILQEIMKKNDTWNIRRLVDDSFVPSSKRPSAFYCKLTDFCTALCLSFIWFIDRLGTQVHYCLVSFATKGSKIASLLRSEIPVLLLSPGPWSLYYYIIAIYFVNDQNLDIFSLIWNWFCKLFINDINTKF